MNTTIHFWEEPLYRLILQITVAQILLLGFIILTIITIRAIRLYKEKKEETIGNELFTPLMTYLAGENSLEATYEIVRNFPRTNVCLELERYATMLGGGALSRIRALYEQLNLRNHGIKLTRSRIWWRRLEGVRLLGSVGGEDVVDELLDGLDDSYAIVRLAAARALGRTRDQRAIKPLLEIMARSKQLSRRQLAQTLIAFGAASHPGLRRIVSEQKGKDVDHRFIAIALEVLALTGDIESADVIRNSLSSTNLEVRIAAFKAAIILHIPLSYDELKKGLADDEWPVRAQAATASGKLGDRAVIDELGKALCDPSWWVRNNAGQALYRLGPAGIDELERIIRESDDRFARDMAARTLTSDPVYNALFRSKKLLDTGKDEASDSSKKGTN